MDYTLDTNAAKNADNLFSRIEEKGRYFGVFTRAEQVTSKKGSKGVDFGFKSETGATADYLTIWTHNGEGKQLQGFNALMAIMTCLRVKGLKSELGEIEKYDNDQKKKVNVQVPLFKDLMGKKIGLLIHMEEYEKTAGGTSLKPVISAPFDANGFTASEILNQAKEATTLTKMEQGLRDRPLKAQASSTGQPGGFDSQQKQSFDDLGDDIPF